MFEDLFERFLNVWECCGFLFNGYVTPPLALLKQIAGNSLGSTALLITERTHTHTHFLWSHSSETNRWLECKPPQENFMCFCRDGVWIVHFWKYQPTFSSEGNLVMCPGSRLCPLPLAQQRRLVPTRIDPNVWPQATMIFKDIFVSQGGMEGEGKAFPQPVGWGRERSAKKKKTFWLLGLWPFNPSFKCQAAWKGRRGGHVVL